ncbi:hypothetical protein Droror1_Dr00027006 [Drosera rotundifolia]
MVSLLRRAVTSHIRVSITPTLACFTHHGSKTSNQQLLGNSISLRWMSSHDDHLTKEEVVDRVLAVIKDFPKVDPSKVTTDVHFQKDLGLDSLDNVELVMALEEEFKLEIPDLEADKIDSTKLAIEYIYNHPMSS